MNAPAAGAVPPIGRRRQIRGKAGAADRRGCGERRKRARRGGGPADGRRRSEIGGKPEPDTVLDADKVVNAPAAGVVPPIASGLA